MIVYALPGAGLFGGIKVGVQLVDILRTLGVNVVVATPGGEAPGWFAASAPVMAREELADTVGAGDSVIFSLPRDHEELGGLGARLVFHCQGTDPQIDPVIADQSVTILTCWRQASEYLADTVGRDSFRVGISVSDAFFACAGPRRARTVAHMSRRGRPELVAGMPDVEHVVIDRDGERDVASKMHSSEVFVAVAENEWFGLPALEAMAAGCAVVSLTTVGGGEYLEDGLNCAVVPADRIEATVRDLLDDDVRRRRLAAAGMITAQRYRRALHAEAVRSALAAGLAEVLR